MRRRDPANVAVVLLFLIAVAFILADIARVLCGCSNPSFDIPGDELAAVDDAADVDETPPLDASRSEVAADTAPLNDTAAEETPPLDASRSEVAADTAPLNDTSSHDDAPIDAAHACKQCAGTCPAGDDDKFCFGSCLSSGFSRCTWTPSGSPRCTCAL